MQNVKDHQTGKKYGLVFCKVTDFSGEYKVLSIEGMLPVAKLFGTEDGVSKMMSDPSVKFVINDMGNMQDWKFSSKSFTMGTCFTLGEEFKEKQPLMKNEEVNVSILLLL